MSDNSINTPQAVLDEDYWRKYDRLPNWARRVLMEAAYEYSVTEAEGLINHIRNEIGTFGLASAFANQIRMNDKHLTQEAMKEKWQNQQPPLKFSRRNTPMRRTARIARASATFPNRRGSTLQNGSASRPSMEFSLFGPETPPPNRHTRTG